MGAAKDKRRCYALPMPARPILNLCVVALAIAAGGCTDRRPNEGPAPKDPGPGAPQLERAAGPGAKAPVGTGFAATVVRVSDGDTIVVRRAGGKASDKAEVALEKVRLSAIDAPELAQAFGKQAKLYLAREIEGQQVQVLAHKRDRYGRLVAKVRFGERSMAERLLRVGLAWHYKRYDTSPRLAALEGKARSERRGLWAQAKPMAPWDWRHLHRRGFHGKGPAARPPSAAHAKPPTPFIGNSRSRVFHQRDCSAASCANCTVPLTSVGSALHEGYRPHRRCVRGRFFRTPRAR